MIPAGYMLKRVVPAPDWVGTPGCEIYSVSGCISEHFADYIPHWRHNGYWLFDSPRVLRALASGLGVERSGLTLFYYEVFEREYHESDRRWAPFAPEPSFQTDVQAPSAAQIEGYDVVTFSVGTSPECSPLSCCSLAARAAVNRRCLFDSFDRAREALERGLFDHSEPGPFRVFSVHSVPG